MFQCSQCEKEAGLALVQCRQRAFHQCPFEVRQERLGVDWKPGAAAMAIGGGILFVGSYYPLLQFNLAEVGLIGVTARIVLLSCCLLLGLFIFVKGFVWIVSTKVTVFSRAEKLLWEGYHIRGLVYRTRMINDQQNAPLKLAGGLCETPASVAALDMGALKAALNVEEGSPPSARHTAKAEAKLEELAAVVFEAALLQLVAKEALQIKQAVLYESSAQQLAETSSSQEYLFWPGREGVEETVAGALEIRLTRLIKDWPAGDYRGEDLLAPSVQSLLNSFVSPPGAAPALSLLLLVQNDAIAGGFYAQGDIAPAAQQSGALERSRTALAALRAEFFNKYPRAAAEIGARVGTFLVQAGHQAKNRRGMPAPGGRIWVLFRPWQAAVAVGILFFALSWEYVATRRARADASHLVAKLESAEPGHNEEALLTLLEQTHLKQIRARNDLRRRAVSALGKMLTVPDDYIKTRALQSLLRLDAPEVTQVLLRYKSSLEENLRSADAKLRAAAASALGRLESQAEDTVSSLVGLLVDPDVVVRSDAARALGDIGADARDAVPALIRALRDNDGQVAAVAADSLGKIGRDAASAVPELQEALSSSEEELRRSASQALKRIR